MKRAISTILTVLTIGVSTLAYSNPTSQMPTLRESYKITHPSSIYNEEDFQRVRNVIKEPASNALIWASYCNFKDNSKYTKLSYSINPQAYFSRSKMPDGREQSFRFAARDAAYATQCAMMWRFLNESDPKLATKYGNAAVKTLNAWVKTCKESGGRISDRFLGFGFQGYQFGVAGDLLRGYKGWAKADVDKYNQWLKDIFFANNKIFLDGTWRPTTCDFHYWANWAIGNMVSALSIGICTEDPEIINYAIEQFYKGHHNGALEFLVASEGFPDPSGKSKSLLAQAQESGRDQGHTLINVTLAAEFCQMAYNLGYDLFGYQDNRILQMFEYVARYNSRSPSYPKRWVKDFSKFTDKDWLIGGEQMPFTQYIYCKQGCGCKGKCGPKVQNVVSPTGRGVLRTTWHLIYNHYVKIKGLDEDYCYYSKIAAEQTIYDLRGKIVGDPGAGDVVRFGDNTSAFDQMGWSSLMFTR